jgi:hypothetical protein
MISSTVALKALTRFHKHSAKVFLLRGYRQNHEPLAERA